MIKITEEKKRLLSNFFSLSTLQALNMILPLITLPYLVRVLGVENFGLINFVLSIIMCFDILVSFGFELSATREVSINRDNIKKLSEIFSSVLLIKGLLAIISFIILFVMIMTISTFQEYALLYYVTFGLIIGNILFPIWFFQGIERMEYITYINVITRSIFTILIFVFVKQSSDFIYIPILNSLGVIIGGCYSLLLIFKKFDIKLYVPSKHLIISRFRESSLFFLSRLSNIGSRHITIIVVGKYFGNTMVGYYTMADKLYHAFKSIGGVVSTTIYPYMSRTKDLILYKKVLSSLILISIIIITPTLFFNEYLLQLVFKINNKVLSNIFIILFSGSIVEIVNAMLGYPLLAAFGHIKYANNSLIYASAFYFVYIIIVTYFFQNIYLVSFSIIAYVLVAFIFRLYYIYKAKIFSNTDIKDGDD